MITYIDKTIDTYVLVFFAIRYCDINTHITSYFKNPWAFVFVSNIFSVCWRQTLDTFSIDYDRMKCR